MTAINRDYPLIGRDTKLAEELGLVSAQWHDADVAGAQMKEMMKRADGRAMHGTVLWLGPITLAIHAAVVGLALWTGSILSACHKIVPIVRKQFKHPERFVKRELPPTAKAHLLEFQDDLTPETPASGVGGHAIAAE